MLGDQGQVNFFKLLKEEGGDQFKDNFEVLLTTEDSLCRLYACTNQVSNITFTETNFPSEYYCESNPRGMVYYEKIMIKILIINNTSSITNTTTSINNITAPKEMNTSQATATTQPASAPHQ